MASIMEYDNGTDISATLQDMFGNLDTVMVFLQVHNLNHLSALYTPLSFLTPQTKILTATFVNLELDVLSLKPA